MTIFSAIDADDDDPEVVKIVPDGFFWVHPTTQKETKKVVTSGKGGGGVLGAAEVGAELTRDKTVEREASNAGTVRGAMQTERRTFGTPNTATWTLMENTTDKTGAPVSMRAAILVKREHVNFQAHFTVVVTPDNKTLVKTWFKSNPKDEPVLYKVDKKPTNVLHRYDQETIDKEGKLYTLLAG
ncbi:hypothetical protein BJ875DRAFT_473944 [Amylocarpus encephaloides]|uniref:Uncharacterized protein n=1 Tax=Amylocarpus encephaloides TaxID=45428 RepID=A0A9P7YAT4_9HELO|nr:hypothetical protein BJ875DRAFT_473944 [Amylocarpus encephaloides]